ncbi:hypothetical protein HMPREF1624_07579 [Sporothrix schenckii ATCC 58251]|uniref:glutathione-specific gamma-glutamylcyclotransferase n=1 Tax=Sporothrix schenckii (strain ATCC 58251 / de Perez 2211183) TaxID=1391915 RepID=U7PK71_SPOS1|nr:hypothetical protein HMPREF1624_07579 [Sporothrix schenckii ATCC 58251]
MTGSELPPQPNGVPEGTLDAALTASAVVEGEFWIFGYAEDHRGTPEAPGRVATLIERSFWEKLTDHHDCATDKVWGVAYRIDAAHAAEVREYLDIREINGYTVHYTPFYPASKGTAAFRTMAYIGTPENPQFTGPQDVQALAEHIYRSTGPSGPNRDYLWGLETALDELSPESGDEHVTDLSNRVRALVKAASEAEVEAQAEATSNASAQ